MIVVLVVALAARQPWECGPNRGCVCQHPGSYKVEHYTYDECEQLDSIDGCIYCSEKDPCHNDTNPESGLHCWPQVKECAMCASPTERAINTMLAPSYTLWVRQRCETTSLCAEDPHKFEFAPNLTIVGGTGTALTINGDGHTLEGPCPMFVFENIVELTVVDLTIVCNSTTQPETKSGILISGVVKLKLSVSGLTVRNHAKSAITVLGGRFDTIIPTMAVDMSGSSFSDVVLQNSESRFSVDVALAMYYGKIDVGGLAPYTSIIVQPSIDPETHVPSGFINASNDNKAPTGLIVYNFTEWTRLFGRDYELILNNKRATLGFTLVETDQFQARILSVGISFMIGGILLILLRYWGPTSYLYQLAKSNS